MQKSLDFLLQDANLLIELVAKSIKFSIELYQVAPCYLHSVYMQISKLFCL